MFQSIHHSLEGPGSPSTGLAFFVNSTTVWPGMHCAPLPVNLMGLSEIGNTVSSRPWLEQQPQKWYLAGFFHRARPRWFLWPYGCWGDGSASISLWTACKAKPVGLQAVIVGILTAGVSSVISLTLRLGLRFLVREYPITQVIIIRILTGPKLHWGKWGNCLTKFCPQFIV